MWLYEIFFISIFMRNVSNKMKTFMTYNFEWFLDWGREKVGRWILERGIMNIFSDSKFIEGWLIFWVWWVLMGIWEWRSLSYLSSSQMLKCKILECSKFFEHHKGFIGNSYCYFCVFVLVWFESNLTNWLTFYSI